MKGLEKLMQEKEFAEKKIDELRQVLKKAQKYKKKAPFYSKGPETERCTRIHDEMQAMMHQLHCVTKKLNNFKKNT